MSVSKEFRFQLNMLRVGEETKCGDCICLRWGFNLDTANPNQFVMLVDGGFASNASALSKQIKKIIKTDRINLIVATHPHVDHIGAIPTFLNEFKVDELVVKQPWCIQELQDIFKSSSQNPIDINVIERLGLMHAYQLVSKAKEISPQIKISEWNGGEKHEYMQVSVRVLGPMRDKYDTYIREVYIGQGKESLMTEEDESTLDRFPDNDGDIDPLNNSSYILAFSFEGVGKSPRSCKKWVLLTADAGPRALRQAISEMNKECLDYQELRFLQLPHHGSINNMRVDILDALVGDPEDARERPAGRGYSAVTVSKQSDNLHPHPVVKAALIERNMQVATTKDGIYTYNLRIRLD